MLRSVSVGTSVVRSVRARKCIPTLEALVNADVRNTEKFLGNYFSDA